MEHDTFILEDAAETVYERPEQHGEPEDTFPLIAEFWNSYLRAGGIPDPNITPSDVAQMFILMKIARSANGMYNEDAPVDVAGYSECWARMQEEQRPIISQDDLEDAIVQNNSQ